MSDKCPTNPSKHNKEEEVTQPGDRARALTVSCTYCGAAIGQECTITAAPLQYAAAHTPRLLDSIKADNETEVPF